MENFKIQKAENQEILERTLKIREEVFTIEKGIPKNIDVDEHDKLLGICDHFLIQYNSKDVGTIRCMRLENGIVRLQRYCFLKEYRKLGLGRETLKYIEKYYKEKGIKEITLDSKYHVVEFYEKCGYDKVSDIFMEAGVEHIKMKKSI